MDLLIRTNIAPRAVPSVPEELSRVAGTVAADWDELLKQARTIDHEATLIVTTPAQMDQAVKVVEDVRIGTGLVVLEAKKDYEGSQFGVVTIGLPNGATVAIMLHVLAANARVPLSRLGRTVLAPLLSWTASRSAYTVVHDEDRWREFVRAVGGADTPIRGVVEVARLLKLGIAEGRVETPFGGIMREAEIKAVLEHTYLGRHQGPVTAEEYETAYPRLARPPSRKASDLFRWPMGPGNDLSYPDLAQVRHLTRDMQSVVRLLNDTVRVHQRQGELRQPSKRLAATNKTVLARGLRIIPLEVRTVEVDFGPVQDELAMGIDQERYRTKADLKRANNLAFFGDLLLNDVGSSPPGAGFRKRLFSGLCLTCAYAHRTAAELCPLGRRLGQRKVSRDERNCPHCLLFDHLLRACPVFHFRCQRCKLLGHIAENCTLDTVELYWLQYLSGCRVALFASLELRGPFGGPFGFGVYLSIQITEEMIAIACEVRELSESRWRDASTVERRARLRAVRMVVNEVPTHGLYYLPLKGKDVSWAEYWQRKRLDAPKSQGSGPYRGQAAPLLSEFCREELVDQSYGPLIKAVAESVIEEHDMRHEVEQLEIERNENVSAAEQLEAELEEAGSFPWDMAFDRQKGGQLISASIISEMSVAEAARLDVGPIFEPEKGG